MKSASTAEGTCARAAAARRRTVSAMKCRIPSSLASAANRTELSWHQMKVPNAQFAQIDRAKTEDYLLSPVHPVGRFKSVVFSALGYSRDAWQQLDADL